MEETKRNLKISLTKHLANLPMTAPLHPTVMLKHAVEMVLTG
jgi:hypothetical protein